MTAAFTQTGSVLTGTLSSQAGDLPVTGTVTGNALSVKFTAQTPAGEIPVTMTGNHSGATLAGKATIEGFGRQGDDRGVWGSGLDGQARRVSARSHASA